jgi:hypothetical protein
LEAAEIRPEGTDLRVILWWRVNEPLGKAYTVFVHLLDEEGHLIGAGDGLPRGGAMPTDQWRAGDLILDEHRVPLPEGFLPSPSLEGGAGGEGEPSSPDVEIGAGGEGFRVGIGFYDSNSRLPAWDAEGRPLPEGMAVIEEEGIGRLRVLIPDP